MKIKELPKKKYTHHGGGIMERSDKTTASDVTATRPDEAAEIDRIMKEIEELEKKMDSPELPKEIASEPEPMQVAEAAKVVALHAVSESLAETDAVPVEDAPLVRTGAEGSSGSLALKIGACTDVTLEFTHANTTVYLSYNEDGLKIATDQGAEFRIPFKRAAA